MAAPARLIDLSIARRPRSAARGKQLGTDYYMSPEQADPDTHGAPEAASDVWGLGPPSSMPSPATAPSTPAPSEAERAGRALPPAGRRALRPARPGPRSGARGGARVPRPGPRQAPPARARSSTPSSRSSPGSRPQAHLQGARAERVARVPMQRVLIADSRPAHRRSGRVVNRSHTADREGSTEPCRRSPFSAAVVAGLATAGLLAIPIASAFADDDVDMKRDEDTRSYHHGRRRRNDLNGDDPTWDATNGVTNTNGPTNPTNRATNPTIGPTGTSPRDATKGGVTNGVTNDDAKARTNGIHARTPPATTEECPRRTTPDHPRPSPRGRGWRRFPRGRGSTR